VRGLLHGAIALYLARYLNVPPATLPGEGDDGLDDLPVSAADIRAALLDTFDRRNKSMLRRALSPAISSSIIRLRR
jgi:hypothetical protein